MPAQQQKIGLGTATIVGMNAMIGAGIFSVPAALGQTVGPAGLITYLFVIIAVWFMGQSLARLAQLYPEEGSFYAYASQWGGHTMGLISAGGYILGLIVAMGLLVQYAGITLNIVFSMLSAYTWGLIVLGALCILNIIGVKLSELGQHILICCTIFPIIAITIICFLHGNPANFVPFMPFGLTNVFVATKAVIFGFFGFEAAASLFNIVKNPEKNVPRALVLAILFVGALYLAFVTSIIYAIPLNDLSLNLTDSIAKVFPGNAWLLTIINFSILSAVVGTIHSMIWSSSELILAFMNNWKSKKISQLIAQKKINHRTTVLLVSCGIFLTFSLLKNVDLFFSLTATAIITAFITSMITLLTLKSEWKSGQNYCTIIGLLTALVILYFAIEGIIVQLMC